MMEQILVDSVEDIYLKKELLHETAKFFTELEIEVMMEKITRKEAAAELGIDYNTFRKRLERKTKKFKKMWEELA